jgi:hypothetical protein
MVMVNGKQLNAPSSRRLTFQLSAYCTPSALFLYQGEIVTFGNPVSISKVVIPAGVSRVPFLIAAFIAAIFRRRSRFYGLSERFSALSAISRDFR